MKLGEIFDKGKDEALDAINATGDRSRSVWRRWAGYALIAIAGAIVILIVRAIL